MLATVLQFRLAVKEGMFRTIDLLAAPLNAVPAVELVELLGRPVDNTLPLLSGLLRRNNNRVLDAVTRLFVDKGMRWADVEPLFRPPAHSATYRTLYTTNCPNGLKRLAQCLRRLECPRDVALEVIRARRDADGETGPGLAMQAGHVEMVEATAWACVELGFTKRVIVELLTARRDDGMTGPRLAMEAGRQGVIPALARTCKAYGIDLGATTALLHAQGTGTDVSCGGYFAIRAGHVEMLEDLAEACVILGLTGYSAEKLVLGWGPEFQDACGQRGDDTYEVARAAFASAWRRVEDGGAAPSTSVVAAGPSRPVAEIRTNDDATRIAAGVVRLEQALIDALAEAGSDRERCLFYRLTSPGSPFDRLSPAAAQWAKRALHQALRPSVDAVIDRMKTAFPDESQPRWDELRTHLMHSIFDPVARLHPQAHAALTQRSLRSSLFRHQPQSSAKLSEQLLVETVTPPPRLSLIQAQAIVEAHMGIVDRDTARTLRGSVMALPLIAQQHTVFRDGRPTTWMDGHPDPEELRRCVVRFGLERAGDSSLQTAVARIVKDIDAVLQPFTDGAKHKLGVDAMAADVARSMCKLQFRASASKADTLRLFTDLALQALQRPAADVQGRHIVAVLREHLSSAQLADLAHHLERTR